MRTGIRFLSSGFRSIGQTPLPTFMIKQSTTTTTFNPISKPNSVLSQLQTSALYQNITKQREIVDSKFEELDIKDFESNDSKTPSMQLDSVMRKRRYKIKKHKFRKRRKAQKALRRKLKKWSCTYYQSHNTYTYWGRRVK